MITRFESRRADAIALRDAKLVQKKNHNLNARFTNGKGLQKYNIFSVCIISRIITTITARRLKFIVICFFQKKKKTADSSEPERLQPSWMFTYSGPVKCKNVKCLSDFQLSVVKPKPKPIKLLSQSQTVVKVKPT